MLYFYDIILIKVNPSDAGVSMPPTRKAIDWAFYTDVGYSFYVWHSVIFCLHIFLPDMGGGGRRDGFRIIVFKSLNHTVCHIG